MCIRDRVERLYKQFRDLGENINSKKSKGGIFDNIIPPRVVTKEYKFSNTVIDSLYDIKGLDFPSLKLIEDILLEMTERGPLISSQLVNAKIRVVGGRYNPDYLDETALKMTVNNAYLKLIKDLPISIMEPVSQVKVKASHEIVGIIMTEAISKRQGKILSIGNEEEMKG